jgi:hypothetical protein
MLTIMLVVTLHLGTIQDVDYQYEGTMEDCITRLKSNVLDDMLNDTGDYTYYYYCVPRLTQQEQEV